MREHTFKTPNMKFPDISPFSEFPWQFFKFPDNFPTLKNTVFPDFSLMCGNPDGMVTTKFQSVQQSGPPMIASTKFEFNRFSNLNGNIL